MKSFECTIANAEESIFSGKLTMLIATSVDGDLGILHGHAPLLAQLNPGPIQLKKEGGEEDVLYVSGGFLEVQPDQVSILADTALRQDQLSEQQIEQERQKALQVVEGKDSSMEYSEAVQFLANAAAQLRTLKELRKLKR